jgi:transcriptional regulator with XRE-family HTH domain
MTDPQQPIDFNHLVGQNIAAARKAAGLSQAEVASELSMRGLPFQQQTVLKVEKGSRPLRLEEAVVLADLLGVEVNDLLRTDEGELAAAMERVMVARAHLSRLAAEAAVIQSQISKYQDELDSALEQAALMQARRMRERFAEKIHEVAADTQDEG